MHRRLLLFALAAIATPIASPAEEGTLSRIVVRGEEYGEPVEELGGYGQPQWAERSRASPTTKMYVLSPFEVFIGMQSESDLIQSGNSMHDLIQEIEVGLPCRFELDLENHLGVAGRRAAESEVGVGVRYALAAWEKIPLNPALSVLYNFATAEQFAERCDRTGGRRHSDGYELRVLLGQEFLPWAQWAANIFFENEFGSGHQRHVGFTQDIAHVVIPDKLEVGVEMRFTNARRRQENRGSANEFVIGPSLNWKPNFHTVVSLAPLFGCTSDSPRVAILAAVSLEFGGGESKAIPASTHH